MSIHEAVFTLLEQVVNTHQTSCWSGWPRSFQCILVPRASSSLSRRGLRTRTRRLWGHRIWSPGFRTSGHFWFRRKLEDSLLKALNHLNLQSLTLRQEQVNAFRNVVENQKWPEVLKSRTSNPVSPEPSGPRSQASPAKGTGGSGHENEKVWWTKSQSSLLGPVVWRSISA